MQKASSRAINQYANAMFRYERLSGDWIDACAGYLRAVFGDSLPGRTVVDYAFGRGNWALAFLRAGAAHVIAIDAAEDNVARLNEYCRERAVRGLAIVHGNVLEAPVDAVADVVWLRGILHHIEPADLFLGRIAAMAPGADAQFYIYAYDRFSLRQFIVETCRRFVRYDGEEAFLRDALCLCRPARMRARDDLTAPYIAWYDVPGLTALLARHGLHPATRYRGFATHPRDSKREEFAPHEWLCGRDESAAIQVLDPPRRHASDLQVLSSMADSVLSLPLDAVARRTIGLGLCNAHFSALAAPGGADRAIIEDFLYLLYVLLAHGATARGAAAPYTALAMAALEGRERAGLPAASEATVLSRHLRENRIRI